MMRSRHWRSFALVTFMAVGVGACGGEGAEQTEEPAAETAQPAASAQQPAQVANLPAGVTQEQVDEGRQLFTGQGGCHACHGPQATGTQLAPDLTDGEWINIPEPSLESVVQLITTGVQQPKQHPAPMPAMGGANLSDDQVRALAAYVLSIAQG